MRQALLMLQMTDTFICAGRVRELDDVAVLFRGIALGGRRSGTGQGERDGQRKSQQSHKGSPCQREHKGVAARGKLLRWNCPVERHCAALSLHSVAPSCRRAPVGRRRRRRRPPARRARPANEPFGYCLNTSTIRGNNLDIVAVVNAASKAGFHAIEPWISEIDSYTSKGGTLERSAASGSPTPG